MGGGGVNNRKLTKPLKSSINGNGIFEYDTQLAPHGASYVEKYLSHKP